MMKKRLLYISMTGTPDIYDPAPYADLQDTGDDRFWVANRLQELGVLDQLHYQAASVTLGDDLPDPDEIDAVIVGGSFHSVNENQPWQQTLKSWLARWRETGRPALGICGGHQTMCLMAGAVVALRASGVKSTSASIDLTGSGKTHPLFEGFEDNPEFHFGNNEHVLEAPDGAVVLARDGESSALAVDLGGNWLSIQFHPEVSHINMMRSWEISDTPQYAQNYRPLPDAPRMLVNFVRYAGMLSD